MKLWEKKLKAMPSPSPVIILLDLFFILLVIFMMSSNFVFLPGVKSVSLPPLRDAEIISANKIIVTVSRNNAALAGSHEWAAGARGFVYSFNGQTKNSREELESSIREALQVSGTATASRSLRDLENAPMIVLRAEKDLPVEEMMNFYSFARKLNVQMFLVTDFEKHGEMHRMHREPLEK